MSTVLEERKKPLREYIPYPVETSPYPGTETGLQFKGILGIWPWPVLNLLLALVERTRGGVSTAPVRKGTILEVVRDERGRIIEIFEREV